jgi:hypothetical protein
VLIALLVLVGVALLAGFVLLAVEGIRYRADREPAPPLEADDAARDRWSAFVLDLVAVLSILGALVTWQATITFGSASDLGTQALRDSARYEASAAKFDSLVEFSARLTQLYQQHSVAAARLFEQATTVRSGGNSPLADLLESEARVEGAQARALSSGFLLVAPQPSPDAANVVSETFDRVAAAQVARDSEPDLRTLGQAHLQALTTQAVTVRDRAQKLLLAAGLIAVAIFWWTVARLGWRHRRLTSAVPGVAAMLASYFLLVVAAVS